ncbi:hypothetical protein RJ639_019415 [Escallonia herrerae]|uniref:Transposase (putative) gypsy type domain-containing protein n=1 Tax=Escallonia herrerae TaxID=1293975 RepID=A0AA88V6I5_9ASTE|nr:hypothetical protein RJ639_019415 [Escallonia herrerae]
MENRRLPDENESANMTTLDEIGVYWDMFINGFRVRLHPFFIRVLKVYGLAPGQFSPHTWRFMSFFIYQCHKLGLNPRLCECGIIFTPEPQDFANEADEEEEEEEEGKNNLENMSSQAQGDPPLFNAQGVLGDIILDELASIHGVEEEKMQDLDFGALVSGSQPKVTETQTKNFVLGLTSVDRSKETSKKRRVSSRVGSRATSSSVRPDTPHRPAWGVSIDELVFKSPRTAWDWSSHAIIPMDRKTLSGYGVTETANRMVQLMSQAMAQVQIGAEKLIAADKVLDKEKKKVMIENNFRREAEKKVKDLSKKLERVELSNAGLTVKNAELSAHVFLDQRLRDSKGALVHGYNECKSDVLKDHPELDMSIYEHKFPHEVASETERRAEEAKRKKAASSRVLTSPSMSRSVGASGSVSMVVSRPQLPLAEGRSQKIELPTDFSNGVAWCGCFSAVKDQVTYSEDSRMYLFIIKLGESLAISCEVHRCLLAALIKEIKICTKGFFILDWVVHCQTKRRENRNGVPSFTPLAIAAKVTPASRLSMRSFSGGILKLGGEGKRSTSSVNGRPIMTGALLISFVVCAEFTTSTRRLHFYVDSNARNGGARSIGLGLEIAETGLLRTGWDVVIICKIYKLSRRRRFHARSEEWVFKELIPVDTLADPSCEYNDNNSFEFGVEIRLPKYDDKGEKLIFTEDPGDNLIQWKIPSLAALDANKENFSETKEIGGHDWYITLLKHYCLQRY